MPESVYSRISKAKRPNDEGYKLVKTFVKISLVVLLLFLLFEATAAGPIISGKMVSNTSEHFASMASTSMQSIQAACLVYIKGLVCFRPAVGWNS